ncbi:MAG TPA: NAD(P)/FAD-dependent oxidoreductase [Alphaproteobacteria bacterium]|nr:NAD(P)/FAD-dependent oxidoreductase [Alphaproteobacteria bacterium]
MKSFDVIIIGAGAAGLMAAGLAGKNGCRVLLLDHSHKIGEKIRISGGGRCNFTNIHTKPANFISENPHFCKSALARYTPRDFITLIESHGIAYHEKTKGQLFCDNNATEIIDMLLAECEKYSVVVLSRTHIDSVLKEPSGEFLCRSSQGEFMAQSLVIATGGLSIPKIGATSFAYAVAKQFGLKVIPTRPALVPLTFDDQFLNLARNLSGLSVDPSIVSAEKTSFEEALLFTHRGLSGPSILQISSYWKMGIPIVLNLLPHEKVLDQLKAARKSDPKKMLRTILEVLLPSRLADYLAALSGYDEQMANLSDKKIESIAKQLTAWEIIPSGTEGYRTAEVTAGGVDTHELSSKTMESSKVSGLYFIGEAVDVTGHLGGFNFQWAWSSAASCAAALCQR